MGGVLAAYLATLGIITYRWGTQAKQAPPPIAYAAAGGLFALVGVAGRADERLGNALGWAVVLAAVFAPRSNITPVQEAFGPSAFQGVPKHVAETPGPYGSGPVKGQRYGRWIPRLNGYVVVDSNGKRIPGTALLPRLPAGLSPFPTAIQKPA